MSMTKLKKKHSVKKRVIFIVSIIALAIALFILCNNYTLTTTYGVYTSDQIKEDIRIVFISDLHGKSFLYWNKMLESTIKAKDPDIIIMGGDMFDKEPDKKDAVIKLAKELNDYEVYFAFGNHESRDKENRTQIKSLLQEAGVKILSNEFITYKKGEDKIYIHGLELPLYFYSGYDEDGNLIYEPNEDELHTLYETENDGLNVLIAHNPIYFKSYAKSGADIVLSGHNHGGCVRLPFLGGIFTPNGDMWNIKYDCGEYKTYNSSMFLTRGLGEWVGPFRAFNVPEIYVVDIKAA